MDDPLGNRDLMYGVLPELTPEERRALDAVDMTPILGTVEERLRFAMDKAVQFMRERDMALASERQLRAHLEAARKVNQACKREWDICRRLLREAVLRGGLVDERWFEQAKGATDENV